MFKPQNCLVLERKDLAPHNGQIQMEDVDIGMFKAEVYQQIMISDFVVFDNEHTESRILKKRNI